MCFPIDEYILIDNAFRKRILGSSKYRLILLSRMGMSRDGQQWTYWGKEGLSGFVKQIIRL
jgi:hypothetical protein